MTVGIQSSLEGRYGRWSAPPTTGSVSPAATDDRAPPNRLRMATYRTESGPGDFGN